MTGESLSIAIVSKQFPPGAGGAETYAYELAEGLAERGHDVEVFTQWIDDPEESVETHDRVTVHRICKARKPLVTFETLWFSLQARRAIDPDRFDVIHGTLMPASTIAVTPLNRIDAPVVLTSHGTSYDEARSVNPTTFPDYLLRYFFHPMNGVMDALSGRAADHIITVSDHTRERLRDLYRFDESRLTTIPPGIDTDRFQPVEEHHPAVSEEHQSILVLSRLDPRKGIDTALKAFARLDRDNVELLIGGTGRLDGPLKKLADDLGVRDQVEFLGFVPDDELVSLYSSVDLFMLTSEFEGFGIVFLEAMACGTPAIGTDVGGIPTAIDDGNGGCLVPNGDIEAIETQIESLLDDTDGYDRMARDARQWAERHDWSEIARRVELLYYDKL